MKILLACLETLEGMAFFSSMLVFVFGMLAADFILAATGLLLAIIIMSLINA